jgi:hypothetical protein
MGLIYILIIFFIFLISYQVFLHHFSPKLIEGMMDVVPTFSPQFSGPEVQNIYKPFDTTIPDNTIMMAQQCAGNVEYLKGRLDRLEDLKGRVDTMQENIDSMQVQLDGLVQQQADYAQQVAGSTPPEITGTDVETTADVETSIDQQNKK